MVCAWCDRSFEDSAAAQDRSAPVSHGICDSCRDTLLGDLGVPLEDLLWSLEVPVFVVDEEGVVRGASRRGLDVVRKDRTLVEGRLGGDVFECVNARDPEGCGRTIHCSGCTVRSTVTHTFETGEARERVPATLKVGDPDHPASIHFFVSTRKLEDRVLLRIEMARPSVDGPVQGPGSSAHCS